ncbi:MAG TPA: class I SAM-dependent methyltransferase [Armatimonadota bacterium]
MSFKSRLRALFKGKLTPGSRGYEYQPNVDAVRFEDGVSALKSKGYEVVVGPVPNTDSDAIAATLAKAHDAGLDVEDYRVDVDAYRSYVQEAGYLNRYTDYYPTNIHEKSLEHFIALSLLDVQPGDVFIDLASENSPLPEIVRRLKNATTFSQDIMYADGIHGDQIGGDACAMPVEDGFASKAALTCSLEHFEGDADICLFRELKRVLKPGGMVAVIPFYLFERAAVQTDPTISVPAGVKFDQDAAVYCAPGWGNRHGRFYSPKSFSERILREVGDSFTFNFYHITSAKDVHESVYAVFAFTATRR